MPTSKARAKAARAVCSVGSTKVESGGGFIATRDRSSQSIRQGDQACGLALFQPQSEVWALQIAPRLVHCCCVRWGRCYTLSGRREPCCSQGPRSETTTNRRPILRNSCCSSRVFRPPTLNLQSEAETELSVSAYRARFSASDSLKGLRRLLAPKGRRAFPEGAHVNLCQKRRGATDRSLARPSQQM